MKNPSPSQYVIQIELPTDLKFLPLIRDCLNVLFDVADDNSPQKSLTYNVELAVYEVCTNILEHAYGGEDGRILLNFCLDRPDKKLIVTIEDTGRSFDLVGRKVELPELGSERGYGLYLVHQLVDDVYYCSDSGTNVWRLIKRL
jgi:serine/threonine-protein kinase RsbW